MAFGLAGACAGFLPYNLARPARIFLGDGGSLPIGFIVAASLMALPDGAGLGQAKVLAAVLFAGLPIVDTSLVVVSRWRAGVPLSTGGVDHLTHRLRSRLGSAAAVAITLGAAQAALGAVAVAVSLRGGDSVVVALAIWVLLAAVAVAIMETRNWTPVRGLRS